MSTDTASHDSFRAPNPMQGCILSLHLDNNLNDFAVDNTLNKHPVKAPDRLMQDQAIQNALAGGMSHLDIIRCAEAFRSLEGSDFLSWFAVISAIPPEDLSVRIQTVAAERPVARGTALAPASPVTKRPLDDNIDYCFGKTNKVPRLEPPEDTLPITTRVASKSNAIRRPCPGDDRSWNCGDRPKDGREGWSFFQPFKKHFRENHLKSFRLKNGTQTVCHFCRLSFHGCGNDLIKHLWDEHMDMSSTH